MNALKHAISYSPLLSPMLLVFIAIATNIAALRWKRLGITVSLLALAIFCLAAMPWMTDMLEDALDGFNVSEPVVAPAGAIVVLGGDTDRTNDPKAPVSLGPISLTRVFLAARAYRRTHLPILVSGGGNAVGDPPVAELMAQALVRDFGVPVRWQEGRSRDTYENAAFSSAILRSAGIKSILLVSLRRDLPRAAWSFRQFGIAIAPEPAPTTPDHPRVAGDFLPSPRALLDSYYVFHEILGMVYYRFILGNGSKQ